MENIIKKILKEKIINIEKMNNSYSSNVYLVTLENKKYIFKVLRSYEKMEVEAAALRKLNKNLNTPKYISSGIYNGINYIIMEYIEGKNYNDDEAYKLNDNNIKEIGCLLKKLHQIPITNEKDKWFEYITNRIEKAHKVLNKYDFNENIYRKLITELKYIKKSYNKSLVHMDFRIGNLILKDNIFLLDFESIKVGDPIFDFIKIKRLLNSRQFEILTKSYKVTDNNFYKKINFYNLFDSYTSLEWCICNNIENSNYYNLNLKEVKKYAKR